jgi:hypothetical protein
MWVRWVLRALACRDRYAPDPIEEALVPSLPWTVVDAAPSGSQVVFLASRLRLRSARHIPGFFRAAFAVRSQVRRSPGAVGVSLIAEPMRKTFWTLSAWTDQASLDSFVQSQPHLGVMSRYHARLVSPEFTTWNADASSVPPSRSSAKDRWAEGKQRLAVQRASS